MQILVASDNPQMSRKTWDVLQRQGFTAQTARNARLGDAVICTAQTRPDAILLVLTPAADRALRVLDELRVITQAPILGIGPSSVVRQILVARFQFALDLDSALDRLDDAGELRQQAVAGGADRAAPVALDQPNHRAAI